MRPLFRATPGEPAGFGASTFNSLAAAVGNLKPMGLRTIARPTGRLIVHCDNQTGDDVPFGGIVGIKHADPMIDYIDDDQFREQPGCVGEVPRLLTYSDATNSKDHRLSWAVALAPIAADTIGPVCVAGLCWVNVIVNDPDQLFVGPKDDETHYAATRDAGLARIISLAPSQGAGVPVPALIHLDPAATLRVEGYLEALSAASATTSTLTTSRAKLRLRERRNSQWEKLDEYVVVENPDEWLTVAPNTYARAVSWNRTNWRLDYAACNVSQAAAQTTSYS